jgi:hypothetical protein
MADLDFTVFISGIVGLIVVVALAFHRHPRWVSEKFPGYLLGPELPKADFLLAIPAIIIVMSPLIWKTLPRPLANDQCLVGHGRAWNGALVAVVRRLPALVPKVWPLDRTLPSVGVEK